MASLTRPIYVEFLTIPCLVLNVLPALRRSLSVVHDRRPSLYIFDTTWSALLLARVVGYLFKFNVQVILFRMEDVRDEEGASALLRILHKDLGQLQSLILNQDTTQKIFESLDKRTRMTAYLAKAPIFPHDVYGSEKHIELWHVLALIQAVVWHRKRNLQEFDGGKLYIYNRPFKEALIEYADKYDIQLHFLSPFKLQHPTFRKLKSLFVKFDLRMCRVLFRYMQNLIRKGSDGGNVHPGRSRLMTEYFGQFNLDRPECVSDLFFLTPDGVQGKDVCLVFNNRLDPVDRIKWEQMSEQGVFAVSRSVQSSLVDEKKVPVFRYQPQLGPVEEFPVPWRIHVTEYQRHRDYWNKFFRTYNIKLYTTWYKYDVTHMAMTDAISDVGGISSVYQRSYESNPSSVFAVGSDIIFGFSSQGHEVHLKSGSDFKYHIAIGYIGDNRFAHLRSLAQKIRNQLYRQGVERIIVYFDENSVSDGRWFMGHQTMRENYTFWLNRLFEDEKLGIIFKPKVPGDLHQRLGPVANSLRKAEQTGRCYVFYEAEGLFHGAFSPAAAAMAGDISIQECLWAGTAGIEAALSGAKTLLLDAEGWPSSPLYRLGVNVVFKDRLSLWRACQDHWKTLGGNPNLGDWSSMINELDPFHDGKAADRMSQYLKWLLEGLRKGESRENVMAMAAERYARQWGKDKIQGHR